MVLGVEQLRDRERWKERTGHVIRERAHSLFRICMCESDENTTYNNIGGTLVGPLIRILSPKSIRVQSL